jgi:hypothetical protein
MILAVTCGVVAVVFVFRNNFENAFVAAAGGAVCWILNYRQQLKEKLPVQNEEDEDSDEEVSS